MTAQNSGCINANRLSMPDCNPGSTTLYNPNYSQDLTVSEKAKERPSSAYHRRSQLMVNTVYRNTAYNFFSPTIEGASLLVP